MARKLTREEQAFRNTAKKREPKSADYKAPPLMSIADTTRLFNQSTDEEWVAMLSEMRAAAEKAIEETESSAEYMLYIRAMELLTVIRAIEDTAHRPAALLYAGYALGCASTAFGATRSGVEACFVAAADSFINRSSATTDDGTVSPTQAARAERKREAAERAQRARADFDSRTNTALSRSAWARANAHRDRYGGASSRTLRRRLSEE